MLDLSANESGSTQLSNSFAMREESLSSARDRDLLDKTQLGVRIIHGFHGSTHTAMSYPSETVPR